MVDKFREDFVLPSLLSGIIQKGKSISKEVIMAKAAQSREKEIKLDDDGYLEDINCWDVNVAEYLAKEEGIEELTSQHWKIITAIRLHYERSGVSPLCREIEKTTGFSKKEFYRLFPSGHIRGAYKVAGLPKPAGCN